MNYFSNIDIVNKFLINELKDVMILPVFTSNIAFESGNHSLINYILDEEKDEQKKKDKQKELDEQKKKQLDKQKLKHSIIKNMLYNNEIKTRKDAEYYFKTLSDSDTDNETNDKIAYYLDFVNEYNLLINVVSIKNDTDLNTAIDELKTDISKYKNDKYLTEIAIDTYLGPVIFQKYNLIDIVVLCGIIIFAIILYFIKAYFNIYLIGIVTLLSLVFLVFLTVIFI